MIRVVFRLAFAALVFSGFSALAAEPPVPLERVPLDLYRLRDWGQRRFDVYMAYTDRQRIDRMTISEREMKHVALHTFTTEFHDDELVLRQYWIEPSLKRGGAQLTLHCRKDPFLSLMRMEVQREAKTWQVDVTDGEFDLEFLGKTRSGRFPANTLTDAALMRVVTLLPREAGKTYSIGQRTMTPEFNILPGDQSVIRCHGAEKVTVGNVEHECTKFSCGEILLWVRHRDNMLLRYEIPGWKILVLRDPPANPQD